MIRLSTAGASQLDRWLAGDTAATTEAAQALQQRLIKASMLHPIPVVEAPLPSVAFVVPAYDDHCGVGELLAALRREFPTQHVVVVDDGSPNEEALAAVVGAHDGELLRHATNRGPAAARNTGWRHIAGGDLGAELSPEVIFFLDADVVPQPGSIGDTLRHLNDAALSGAAPRIMAQPGPTMLQSYESCESPLDLGSAPGLVAAGSRTSYVPSAALALRTEALVACGGFDEGMRFGEDVDLVWRLTGDGHQVRYAPNAVMHHRARGSIASLLKQRFSYGSSAGPLGARHGDVVAPLRLPVLTLAGWLAVFFGGNRLRVLAAAGAVPSVLRLSRKLEGSLDDAPATSVRLIAGAHKSALLGFANLATRNYAPLLLVLSKTRRLLAAAAIVPPMIDWFRRRPAHNPAAHIGLKTAEDTSYALGVWAGVLRERAPAALLPVVQFPTRQSAQTCNE